MRILILVQNYPPERGPVRYTRDLAVALAAHGHQVKVITGLPHYPTGHPYPGFGVLIPVAREEDGVRVQRVPLVMSANHQKVRRLVGFLSFAVSALPWTFSDARPDVIIASVPPLPVAPLGLVAARLRRVPLVMLLRDVEPLGTLELRGLADRPWARHLVRLTTALYARADRIVVVHDSQLGALLRYGLPAGHVETITHGIDLDHFLEQARRAVPFSLPRRPGRSLALYLGTIGEAQDLQTLVRAWDEWQVRALPIDLCLIGGGEHAPVCERLIHAERMENVRLLPPVPLEWVAPVLRQADLLVTSYKKQDPVMPGMIGSKVYEYLASGKPVLVHGRGVATDLVQAVGNGWWCEAGDGGGLAGTLSEFLRDPEHARHLGERGRDYVRTHFLISTRHQRWELLLQSLF